MVITKKQLDCGCPFKKGNRHHKRKCHFYKYEQVLRALSRI